jgi:endonuclease/exonuclease/phosphatase (EEP) superfamily protein YafD
VKTKFLGRGLRLTGLFGAAGVLCAAASVLGFLGRYWWFFDLAASFRPQYALVLLVMSAFLFFRRRPRAALLSFGAFALNIAVLVPLFFGRPSADPGPGTRLRVLLLDVQLSNRRADLVLAEIARWNPDIVVLEEVDDFWNAQLDPLVALFGNGFLRRSEDDFGYAIFCKMPVKKTNVQYVGTPLPSILMRFEFDGKPLNLIAVHTVPPNDSNNSSLRDLQLDSFGELLADRTNQVILVGTLNATPWSPHFRDLLRRANLVDSSIGYGLQPTWPASPWPFRIPIDHCLVSPSIRVIDRQLGNRVGSDHLPLIVDLVVPK